MAVSGAQRQRSTNIRNQIAPGNTRPGAPTGIARPASSLANPNWAAGMTQAGAAMTPAPASPPGPPPADTPPWIGGGGGAPIEDPSLYAPAAPAAPARPSEEALGKGALETADYIARKAARDAALSEFQSRQKGERERYDVDYMNAMKDLGVISDATTAEGLGDATKLKLDRGEQLLAGGQNTRSTASGRAFMNQVNDFASRGLLQSGLFSRSSADLEGQLLRQIGSTQKGRTGFLTSQNEKLADLQTQQRQEQQAALEAAKQELLNRWSEDLAAWSAG